MIESDNIFIYGAPGTGKTTYSLKLKAELGYPLVEADYLREVVAQKEKSKAEDPFLYVGTKEAFRLFGTLTVENVIKGLKAVRHSMSPYVNKEISKFAKDLILEAAFLDPAELNKIGKLLLIITSDEATHRSQYFQHREQNLNNAESFEATRIIQNYLIQEAGSYNLQILENTF